MNRPSRLLLLLCGLSLAAPPLPHQAPSVRLGRIGEKLLEVEWDSVPGAQGYHVYTAPRQGTPPRLRTRANHALITSGTRFAAAWRNDNGEMVRMIKGERHWLSVAAVFPADTGMLTGPFSAEVGNTYLDPWSGARNRTRIEQIVVAHQRRDPLPVNLQTTTSAAFIGFMEGVGTQLYRALRDALDFRETGACVPVSALVVLLLEDQGIPGWRVEGTFIREWHTFVVLGIDGVEYVLDFAADQFVPDVSPVLIPRDSCFLGADGRLGGEGEEIYLPGRIYSAQQSLLVDSDETRLFRDILDSLRTARPPIPRQEPRAPSQTRPPPPATGPEP